MDFKHTILVFISIWVFIIASNLSGQKAVISPLPENGAPFVTNYSPETYGAHGQNWAIIQDKNNFMYFGNTDGSVLQYDGVHWRQIPIRNGSIVRSLAIDSSGTVYAGGQNEIGYLAPDSSGSLKYVSILADIPEAYRNFGNVWRIHFMHNRLYFSSRKYLFRREENGTYKVWQAKNVFHVSFMPRPDQLFIHQRKTGLMVLDGDTLRRIPGGARFGNDLVYSVISLNNQKVLITSRNSGLFIYDGKKLEKFNTPAEKWLIDHQVYHAILLSNGQIALGTLRGGLIILDQKGNVINLIDKESGLQDDQIWFLYQDAQGGLWTALNKGISRIEYPSSWSFFNDTNGLEGSVHDIVRHKGILYAATGMGVYRLKNSINKLGKNYFEILDGLRGQSWDLLSLKDRLLVSGNQGIFEYKNSNFYLISKKSAWQFCISKQDSNRIYFGLDQGVASLYKNKNQWIEEARLPGFKANARTLTEDNSGRLWVGTVYEGLWRIDFQDHSNIVKEIKNFDAGSGLPNTRYNLVFPYKEKKVLFGTMNGIYRLNETTQQFHPIPIINTYPVSNNTYTILSSNIYGKIWFNSNDKLVELSPKTDSTFRAIFKPFWRLPASSTYCIFPEKTGILWLGGPDGIYRYDPSQAVHPNLNFTSYIRRVRRFGEAAIYYGVKTEMTEQPIFPYSTKAMRFEFAAPYFVQENLTRYRFRLSGFDSEWSSWTGETQKEYTNLQEGSYKFEVMAQNFYGEISSPANYSFEIQPPLYRRWWAWLLYLLTGLILAIAILQQVLIHARHKAILEHQKKEQSKKRLEDELRSQLAADFHDELGTQITRISLFSEILKNELVNLSETSMGYLEKISRNADNLYNETRDFIWQLDPNKDTLLDFVSRINSFACDLLNESSIEFKLQNTLKNPEKIKLSMELRQHLIRIFKEALHNSFKHSNCKTIVFQVSHHQGKLVLVLRDDGKGFNVSTGSDGNGLNNMHKRADKIGAVLELISNNSGTKIILKIGI